METVVAGIDRTGESQDRATEHNSDAERIYRNCVGDHLSELHRFNRHLASRPLTTPELTLFLASMAAFNRHTIAGIAILAGRLSDELFLLDPLNGHRLGAHVLDAAVDEYGLRES